MRVMVTGSRGFVGSHLVKQLADMGLRVLAFNRTPPQPEDIEFLKPVLESVEFATGDITDGRAMSTVLSENRIGGIIHSAAVNGEAQARKFPELTLRTNVGGTLELLIAANRAGIKKFLFIGSGVQYGPRTDLTPLKEDDPCSPRGIYPSAKQAAEMMGMAYGKLAGMDFVSVRISAPYGPMDRQDPAPTHIKFWCRAALDRTAVKLDTGGEHRRDFTYIKDAVGGIAAVYLADRPSSTVYNISSGKSYRVSEVVAILKKLIPGANLTIGGGILEVNHPQVENSLRGPLDISRAAKEFHFAPRYPLEEGIKEYMGWLRNHPF